MTDIATPPQPMLKPPRFRALRTITALILREMGSTYGMSPGGYVWAVLQPVGMVREALDTAAGASWQSALQNIVSAGAAPARVRRSTD